MQVGLVLVQALQLANRRGEVLLGPLLLLRRLGLDLGLGGDLLLQRDDRRVGVGDDGLIGLLGLALGLLGLGHERLGLHDQLLEHLHDPRGALAGLVGHLRHRRHGARGGVLPARAALEQGLGGVVLGQARQGLLQDGDGGGLVRDRRLVVEVLGLPRQAGALQLRLRPLELLPVRGDLLLQGLNSVLQLRDVGREVGLEVLRLHGGHLVLLELRLAPVVLLDLVLHLLLQHHDHVVDRLLDLRKGVQLDGVRQHRQLRAVRLRGHLAQRPGRLAAAVLHLGALRGGPAGRAPLQQAVRARGRVLGLVLGQDPDRLRHGNNLRLARRLALLPVLVRVRARHLHVLQEGLVVCQDGLLLAQVFLGLGQLVRGLGQLVLLLLLHFLPSLDLHGLGGAELLERLGAGGLGLLRLAKVCLHLLLQLLEDANDLAALSAVGRVVERSVVSLREHRGGLQGLPHHRGVLSRPAGRGSGVGVVGALLQELVGRDLAQRLRPTFVEAVPAHEVVEVAFHLLVVAVGRPPPLLAASGRAQE
mmetsp:Transcript_105381/g.286168  ORF Transcript_105381/g.286168 Transcript_105381/m.286168 type:complete len:532 (+) Transcript_105381:234-1829(+)